MSRYRRALGFAISSESKAYGFTLVVWTSGAVATEQQGLPGYADAMAFLSGAVLAMGLVVLVTFGSPKATWSIGEPLRYALGAIHIVSVAAAVTAGWAVGTMLEESIAFGLSAFVAVLVYQLVLGLEVALSTASPEREPSD